MFFILPHATILSFYKNVFRIYIFPISSFFTSNTFEVSIIYNFISNENCKYFMIFWGPLEQITNNGFML